MCCSSIVFQCVMSTGVFRPNIYLFSGPGGATPIPYAGNGFSSWCWVKIVSSGTNYGGAPQFSIAETVFFQVAVQIGFSNGPGGKNVTLNCRNPSDTVDLFITEGAWHFVHMFYDHAQQKFGIQFDNGLKTMLSAVSDAGVSALGAAFYTSYSDPATVIYDEAGIVTSGMLTNAQLAYLYNGGYGRTWPIALP